MQLRRDGALNQFIDELSSNIQSRRYSEAQTPTELPSVEISDNVQSVIENVEKNVATEQSSEESVKSDLLSQPSHFVTVIEVKEPQATAPSGTSSFKAVRSGYENVIIENNKGNSSESKEIVQNSFTQYNNVKMNEDLSRMIKPTAPPISQDLRDMKKKIPPR